MPDERNELLITREFNAPRNLVWKAWTDPEHLPHWWGPKGMPTSVKKFDLRVGGTFLYHMQAPQGGMWGKFVYREIVAPTKLVFVTSFSNEQSEVTRAPFWDTWPLEILNTVTFEERQGRTIQTLRGQPLNATQAEWAKFRQEHQGVTAGYNGTMDQLRDFLAGGTPTRNAETFKLKLIGDTDIEMSREFDAPKHLVFLAHTKCEHMKRWWGPRGFEFAECSIDFREGGKWRIVQRDLEGNLHAFRGEYRRIVPDELIEWTFEYEGMPGEIAVETMTLTEKDGRTTLKALSKGPSKEGRDAMVASGMEWGARQTWDRLEELATQL